LLVIVSLCYCCFDYFIITFLICFIFILIIIIFFPPLNVTKFNQSLITTNNGLTL
jgi:hypothetical protein